MAVRERVLLTSDSVLLLLASGRPWDSEALVRPVAEASVKLAFISLAPDEERDARAHDFYHVGLDLLHYADDRKLRDFLSIVPNPDGDAWRPFREMLLSPDELSRIGVTYSSKTRNDFADRWSFRRMSQELGRTGEQIYENLSHATFSYTLNSHVLHRDAIGIALLWERQQRPEQERLALELAHATRIISDVLAFAGGRLHAITVASEEGRREMVDWWRSVEVLMESMNEARVNFDRVMYGTSE